MEAACRGAHEGGGLAVGILPGEREEANSFLDIAIVTGMGQARNAVIVKSADGCDRPARRDGDAVGDGPGPEDEPAPHKPGKLGAAWSPGG